MVRILRLALTVIFLSCVVPCHSDRSFFDHFRKLEHYSGASRPTAQVSPSPSPVSVENRNSGNAQSPVNSPKKETCDNMVVDKCVIVESHVSACVPFDGKVSQAKYVLVMNDDESSHKASITVFPANITVEGNIDIPGHQSKKVNLQLNMGSGYSSILLTAENGNCTIQLGASLPKGFYMYYVTPVNGTYLFFVTVLFIGGTLICCKLRRKGRHLDGVKYKELEMGQQEHDSTFTIESHENWDEEWGDDDWDAEKR